MGFSAQALRGNNGNKLSTFAQIRKTQGGVPRQLQEAVRSPELEVWFQETAGSRLATLGEDSDLSTKDALEMGNRFPDGSMHPISLQEQLSMPNLVQSPQDILDRAQQGVELLKQNGAARGVPVGGASSRGAKWAAKNPVEARAYGFTSETPRFLYKIAGKSLAQLTFEFSQTIARSIGSVFPNVVMSNSEIVGKVANMIQSDLGNWKTGELENSVIFNQIVLPRMWVEDQKMIEGKLYPAGHGDYPYLMALYNMAKTLHETGNKYFVFSNADEWMWQADPVMISIAQELFDQGHHMVIIGVENINDQLGGGFVKKADGTQSLVETPRLPWEVMRSGKPPIALNTTFYICDAEYLASHQQELLDVEKSLVIKEVPGRKNGEIEQIFGVDSWAGDVFSEVLNPAFIQWPRLNFLGIKDGGFISGTKEVEGIGGRTYAQYMHESVSTFGATLQRLIAGERSVAEFLHSTGYSYLPLGKDWK